MAGSSAIKAGEGFIELFLKSDKLHAGLTAAGKKLAGWSAGLGGVGAAIAGASGAVLTPLLMMVKSTADAGDNLRDMSMRTGASVEALSELGYAAELSGNDLEGIEGALTKMQQALGSKKGGDALKSIGLSLKDIQGLSPDKQLEVIGGAISAIEDPAKRTTAWLAMFGKAGTKLAPMFENGAEGVRAMREELAEMGGTTSQEAAEAADSFNDAFSKMNAVVGVVKDTIGGTLIPVITDLMAQATQIIMPIAAWVKENKELVVTVFKVAAAGVVIGSILAALGTAGLALSGIILGLKTVLIGVAAVVGFMLSPIGAAIAAVTALAVGFVYVTGLAGTLIAAFKGITAALMGGKWGLAGSIMMKTLEIAWISGLSTMMGAFHKFGAGIKEIWFQVIDRLKIEWAGFKGLVNPLYDSQEAINKINADASKRRADADKAGTDIYAERLKKAKDELQALIAEANKTSTKKKFQPYDVSTLGPKKPAIPPSAMASTGAFSGFAARILGGRTAQTVNERIAAASEETNDKLDELIEAAKAGGAEWAP